MRTDRFALRAVGVIRSTLTERKGAPRQGSEGAPDAWLEVKPWARKALLRVAAGDELIVITWLHLGQRDVFRVYPRFDKRHRLHGVFATVRRIVGNRLRIGPIEAVDGTPVVDIKPVF